MNKNYYKGRDICSYAIDLYNRLRDKRSSLDDTWQQVAKFVRPQRIIYGDSKINHDVYDSTAALSAEFLISAIWSLVSSSTTSWFNITLNSRDNENQEISDWLAKVNNLMKHNLSDAGSGFYHKSYEFYTDLVCFGTGVFYCVEDSKTKKVVYSPQHLHQCLIHKTYNEIDTVIRVLEITSAEAIELFGYDRVSKNIRESYKKRTNDTYLFLRLCIPASYFDDKEAKLKNMLYGSYYIDMDSKNIILKSGYYEFPYMIARWSTSASCEYGQSPAMLSLSDIKMINAMSKTMLVAAQKQVDPPILAPNEIAMQGIKTNPGGVIYGGLDATTGNQLLKPLQINTDFMSSYNFQEQRRMAIKEAFYYNLLWGAYSNAPTATEVISVDEQKLQILGSKISRIQKEFLYPLLKRQFYIMMRLNLLPKEPSSVNLKDIEVEFLGVWNRYQGISHSINIKNLYSALSQINLYDGDVKNKINWDEVIKLVVEGNGLPSSILGK